MDKSLHNRFIQTLEFLNKYIPKDKEILDLGDENELSRLMKKEGYKVSNTKGEDLDVNYHQYLNSETTTAFEIFEHMFAPFNILNELRGEMVISVPLRLWFQKSYFNKQSIGHYHEFEQWQFEWLLKRTGWELIDSKYIYDVKWFGIRPFLRLFYPSFYLVYVKKRSDFQKNSLKLF